MLAHQHADSAPRLTQMLNVNFGLEDDIVANGDLTDDPHRVETTVFEVAGPDRPGLLADVTQLLTTNDCDVRSAAVRLRGIHGHFLLQLQRR